MVQRNWVGAEIIFFANERMEMELPSRASCRCKKIFRKIFSESNDAGVCECRDDTIGAIGREVFYTKRTGDGNPLIANKKFFYFFKKIFAMPFLFWFGVFLVPHIRTQKRVLGRTLKNFIS